MAEQSLQRKITLIISISALVSFGIIALLTGLNEYRTTKAEHASNMQARVNVALSLVASTFFQTNKMVGPIIINQSSSSSTSQEERLSQLDSLGYFESHGESFYILDPDGIVLLISEPYADHIGLDFSTMIMPGEVDEKHLQHHQSLLTKDSVVTLKYPLASGNLLVIERTPANIITVMNNLEASILHEGEIFFILWILLFMSRILKPTNFFLLTAMAEISGAT